METDYAFLNQAVRQMIEKITSVGGTIDGALQPIFFITGVLLLVMACIKFMWQKDLSPLAAFVVRYFQLMVVIFVSGQWMPLTDGYVSQMGSFGSNAAGFDILELAPSAVILRAMEIASKMYTENMSWMRLIFGSSNDNIAHLLLGIGCIGTILLAVFMAAWIMLFFVVFKLASVVALVFLAFMMFDATRFMAAPGIARILAYGVQMLVLGLACGLFFMTLEGLDLTGQLHVGQTMSILVVLFFFGLLFKYTTDVAREQISGMPSMDLHDIGRTGSRAAMTAASMIGGVGLGALGTMGGLKMAGIGGRGAAGAGSARAGGNGGGGASGSPAGLIGGGAPGAVFRMLDAPMKEASWTEARDLPKSASRLLAGQKSLPNYSMQEGSWTEGRDLPKSNKPTLPPPPRQLPPPRS